MNYSPKRYLQFPGSRSGKLQVDNTCGVGNVQQLFQALLHSNYTTWRNRKISLWNMPSLILGQCKLILGKGYKCGVYQMDRWARFVVMVHWVTRWPPWGWGQRALPTCSLAHFHGWRTAGGPSMPVLSPQPTLKPGRRKTAITTRNGDMSCWWKTHLSVAETGIFQTQTFRDPLST